jgi:hypothetical protein
VEEFSAWVPVPGNKTLFGKPRNAPTDFRVRIAKPGRMMPSGGVCMQSRQSHILAHFGSLVLLLLLCLIFFFPFG